MNLRLSDPMEEFPHVVPVTVRNAALLLREAEKAEADAVARLREAEAAFKKAKAASEDAVYLRKAAVRRLYISALQPNGGEE